MRARIVSTGPALRGPVPVVNLGHRFMGQAQQNRLLSLPVKVILNNVMIGSSAGLPADQAALVDAIQAAPTPEETEDLVLFRQFFVEPWIHGLQRAASSVSSALQNITLRPFGLFGRGRFLSGPLIQTIPQQQLLPPFRFIGIRGLVGPGAYFGVDGMTWAEARPIVRNAMELVRALANYPLPSPIPEMPIIFYDEAQADLSEAARYPGQLDPQLARFMVTMTVLENYNTVSARIIDELEEEAEEARRGAIIEAVVIGIASLVLPAVVGAGLAAIKTVMDAREAREAAKDMKEAAQQFAATDAAFAAEVRRAADIIEYETAQAEAQAAAASQAAVQPAATAAPVPEEGGVPTELLVGGGIAAAAAAAFALLS